MITTPFLLEKETGLRLKEKVHPCCRSRVNCPLFRGQNAPLKERRFLIVTAIVQADGGFLFNLAARIYFHKAKQKLRRSGAFFISVLFGEEAGKFVKIGKTAVMNFVAHYLVKFG